MSCGLIEADDLKNSRDQSFPLLALYPVEPESDITFHR